MCLVPRYIMLHHYHMTWCHEVIICGIKIGTCYQSQFGSFDSGILRDVFSGLRAESSGCANRTRLWIVSSHTWQSRFKSTFDLERQRIPRLSTIFPPGQNGLLSHSRSDNQDWKWKRHALSWAYLRELQNRIRLWAPSSNQSTRTLTASQRRTHTPHSLSLFLSRAWSFETRCNAHLAFPHTGVSMCEPYFLFFCKVSAFSGKTQWETEKSKR